MRIGYVVSRLDAGGAERQVIALAGGLGARGHVIDVFAYGGAGVLDSEARAVGATLHYGSATGRLAAIRDVRSWLRTFRPAVVQGVMKRASTVSVMATLGLRDVGVVANDYSTASYARHKPVLWGSLAAFAGADHVVTETVLNQRGLEQIAPWLRGKVSVIRNGLDVDRFAFTAKPARAPGSPFQVCAVGRVIPLKNALGLVEAVGELRRRGRSDIVVVWYGRTAGENGLPTAAFNEAIAAAERLGLGDAFAFAGPTDEVERVYASADAFIHPSFQEGFPNAVAEAMATGLPIAVGDVADLPLAVEEAGNGIVFNPRDPVSIADAMEHLADATPEELTRMARASRALAERWFSMSRFVDDHENLYRRLAR